MAVYGWIKKLFLQSCRTLQSLCFKFCHVSLMRNVLLYFVLVVFILCSINFVWLSDGEEQIVLMVMYKVFAALVNCSY